VRTADEPTGATTARASGAGADARRVLDRYRLVRQIGSGGFGVVWLAEDERLERAVAVKRIAMHDDAVAARAEREARAAARLSHPGIVALYESGRDDEAFYLVSELVRGRTLAELMRDGELPIATSCAWAWRCATPWPTPTGAASSTATSSRAT